MLTQTLPSPPPGAVVSRTLCTDFELDYGTSRGFAVSPGDASRPVVVIGFGTVLLGVGLVVVAGPGLCANAAADRVNAMPNPNALK